MQTGDGLLVRLLPIGTISLAAFSTLCAAAREHGNGVIEITSRGSIQVRGLSAISAPRFATAVAALDIAAEDGVPVLCDALAGLDAEEIFDFTSLVAELRRTIARHSLAAKLAPKVSIVIDGGGAIGLEAVGADIRLRAQSGGGDVAFCVGVGGDEARATELGCVAPARAVAATLQLLDVIARSGPNARARDILAAQGVQVFRDTLTSWPGLSRRDGVDRRGDPIGAHRLHDGTYACGIGLAFGHADASSLEHLADAARAAGASGFRAAPGRTLFAIGLTPKTAAAFTSAAEQLGFIVRADDPRRKVVACAGSPICASAHIASRALAPTIAATAAPRLDGTIHISGCAKGCAQAAAAVLTVVGTPDGCALVADGSARDTPFATVSADELPAAIARYMHEHAREAAHV
jgi:precorrin-3B synthase